MLFKPPDLRHADAFSHVIDASGTTNEKGENSTGYDPCNDVSLLTYEIEMWIFNNLNIQAVVWYR